MRERRIGRVSSEFRGVIFVQAQTSLSSVIRREVSMARFVLGLDDKGRERRLEQPTSSSAWRVMGPRTLVSPSRVTQWVGGP